MEKQKAYVVESPSGYLLWATFSVRRADAIKHFMNLYATHYERKWSTWNSNGYKTVAIGKI